MKHFLVAMLLIGPPALAESPTELQDPSSKLIVLQSGRFRLTELEAVAKTHLGISITSPDGIVGSVYLGLPGEIDKSLFEKLFFTALSINHYPGVKRKGTVEVQPRPFHERLASIPDYNSETSDLSTFARKTFTLKNMTWKQFWRGAHPVTLHGSVDDVSEFGFTLTDISPNILRVSKLIQGIDVAKAKPLHRIRPTINTYNTVKKYDFNCTEQHVHEVAKQIAHFTGYPVIVDDILRAKISISNDNLVSAEEAFQDFAQALSSSGIVVLRSPHLIKVLSPVIGQRRAPFVFVDSTPPESYELVTAAFRYKDQRQVREIKSLVTPKVGDFAIMEEHKVIVVIDHAVKIRQMMAIANK